MDTAPLSGLRVIEFSAFVAAPSAGLALAQLGAEVIRVDPPGGNIDIQRAPLGPTGRSLYWASLNRGKKSVEIDVRSAEGRGLMQRLICSGDPAENEQSAQPTSGTRNAQLAAQSSNAATRARSSQISDPDGSNFLKNI